MGARPRTGTGRTTASIAALALWLGASACGDAAGPEFTSELQVLLRADEGGGAVASLADPDRSRATASSDRAGPPVPPEAVGSVTLEISRVEALPAGAPPGDPQAWAPLGVARPPVDVLGLPAGGIELAAGGFPAGQYVDARVFVPSATVTLSTTATVGDDVLPPGTYQASVPAGADFGVDVEGAQFTVPDGAQGTIVVVVDVGSTLASLEWVEEQALVLVHPVLRAGN